MANPTIIIPAETVTREDAIAAWNSWGCGCGPAALAAAMEYTLDEVKPHIPRSFFERDKRWRWLSTSMMREALGSAGASVFDSGKSFPERGLIRVQWLGPWMEDHPREAVKRTHWVAGWTLDGGKQLVYDVNSGYEEIMQWASSTVPIILAHGGNAMHGATGSFEFTHVWEVRNDQLKFF